MEIFFAGAGAALALFSGVLELVLSLFAGCAGCVGALGAFCVNLIFNVGDEKVKPRALSRSQPPSSFTLSVAKVLSPPSLFTTETVAYSGALPSNP